MRAERQQCEAGLLLRRPTSTGGQRSPRPYAERRALHALEEWQLLGMEFLQGSSGLAPVGRLLRC